MTIETKYNIGQEVWFQKLYVPFCGNIYAISLQEEHTVYHVKSNSKCRHDSFVATLEEHELFPTKEELLKSL